MFEKYEYSFFMTPEGKSIYKKWRNIEKCRCPEWDDFDTFCEWAQNNKDFTPTAFLKKHDIGKPHSPENSYYREKGTRKPRTDISKPKPKPVSGEPSICEKWNKTVNRIRAYYGMEPLEVKR